MDTERIATELFGIIDDIDTLDDLCKDNDKLFRHLTMQEAAKRFKFCTTDGHKVFMRGD